MAVNDIPTSADGDFIDSFAQMKIAEDMVNLGIDFNTAYENWMRTRFQNPDQAQAPKPDEYDDEEEVNIITETMNEQSLQLSASQAAREHWANQPSSSSSLTHKIMNEGNHDTNILMKSLQAQTMKRIASEATRKYRPAKSSSSSPSSKRKFAGERDVEMWAVDMFEQRALDDFQEEPQNKRTRLNSTLAGWMVSLYDQVTNSKDDELSPEEQRRAASRDRSRKLLESEMLTWRNKPETQSSTVVTPHMLHSRSILQPRSRRRRDRRHRKNAGSGIWSASSGYPATVSSPSTAELLEAIRASSAARREPAEDAINPCLTKHSGPEPTSYSPGVFTRRDGANLWTGYRDV